ncbi:hypothetical protein FOL46_008373 [Perkinsus olseni]|uniref:Uncharacterized protein n=1 Tax=Perkinsus olseni TaxID=32597 RepID=A0A7J6L7H1_PEROL|nr:hypothetical protein FOL46_008373 [Perkinsus olseni]
MRHDTGSFTTGEAIRPPAAFNGSGKYKTLFGPPSGGSDPAWVQQKQDELTLLHDKYKRQSNPRKTVSRDAAWEEKRRKFVQRRGNQPRPTLGGSNYQLSAREEWQDAQPTTMHGRPGDQPSLEEHRHRSPHDNRGIESTVRRTDHSREGSRHSIPVVKQLAEIAERDHNKGQVGLVDEGAAVPITEAHPEGSNEISRVSRRDNHTHTLAGIGEHEWIAETVRQQERKNLREYLGQQTGGSKVVSKRAESPEGAVLPGIGSSRTEEAERRRKEIQEDMRRFLAQKPPAPVIPADEGCALKGLGDDDMKRKEDIRRQQRKDLEDHLRHGSPDTCELTVTLGPKLYNLPPNDAWLIVSRRVARARSRSESPVIPDLDLDPREQELRLRRKRQQDEQRQWLDEQIENERKRVEEEKAARRKRIINMQTFNVAEAGSRARSRPTSRSPSPEVELVRLEPRQGKVKMDAVSQSCDSLFKQDANKKLPNDAESSAANVHAGPRDYGGSVHPIQPSHSKPFSGAALETKDRTSVLFNALFEQQRKLGEQNAAIDELRRAMAERETQKSAGNVPCERENPMPSQHRKLQELMEMLLTKLSPSEQPSREAGKTEALSNPNERMKGPDETDRSSLVKPILNKWEDVLEALPYRTNSTARHGCTGGNVPPTKSAGGVGGPLAIDGGFAPDTSRKSIFERSLVGTRMWLPVPHLPAVQQNSQAHHPSTRTPPRDWTREKTPRVQSRWDGSSGRAASSYDRPGTGGSSMVDADSSSVDGEKLERVVRMIKKMREADNLTISSRSSPTGSGQHTPSELEDVSPHRSSTSSAAAPLSKQPSIASAVHRDSDRARQAPHVGPRKDARESPDPFLQTVVLSEHLGGPPTPTISPSKSSLWSSTLNIKEDLLEAVDRICAECDATTAHLGTAFEVEESTRARDKDEKEEKDEPPAARVRPFKELHRLLSSHGLSLDEEVIDKLKSMTSLEHKTCSSGALL